MRAIHVIVVYALPDIQYIQEVEVKLGSTIKDAILASKILRIVKNLKFYKHVGIYNKIAHLNSKIQDGDRIEIYRCLITDPKERRRKNFLLLKNKKVY